MDMPVMAVPAIIENVNVSDTRISLFSFGKIADLGKVSPIMKETWDAQTLSNIRQGKVVVPDDVINKYLAMSLEREQPEQVKALTVQSFADQRIKITASTKKKGRVVLICKVQQFEHDKNHSVMKLKVVDKKLLDEPVLSWIFSKVSLAMVSRVAGHVNVPEGVEVKLHGNEVTVDFHKAIYNSPFGQLEFFGYKPIDALIIRSLTPQKDSVELSADLDLPEQVKSMLQNAIE
jgi:hypothetical protein